MITRNQIENYRFAGGRKTAKFRRKAKWQFGHDVFMTLCIGAIARSENRYLTVSDLMLSTDIISWEPSITKASFVGRNPAWITMFAGDPTHAAQVTGEVISMLAGHTSTPFQVVAFAYRAAFKRELEKKVNNEVLSVYGLTREEFIKEGRSAFGDEEFGRILEKVSTTELETEFLVGNPSSLFSISDPGIIHYHDAIGFHAIGTGCVLAQAALNGIFDQTAPLREMLYRLLAAKFRAESPHVGRKTFVTLTDHNLSVCEGFRPEDCERIRAIWESKGQPVIPKEYFDFIGPELSLWPFEMPTKK